MIVILVDIQSISSLIGRRNPFRRRSAFPQEMVELKMFGKPAYQWHFSERSKRRWDKVHWL